MTLVDQIERAIAQMEQKQRELEVANRDLELQLRELRSRNAWVSEQLVLLAARSAP